MRSVFDKEFYKWENLKESWEYKTSAIVLRVVFALWIVFYLISSSPKAWMWAQMKIVRLDDISEIHRVIDKHVAQRRQKNLYTWLLLRPREETPALLEAVPLHAPDLSSGIFFILAERARTLDREEERTFWYFYGRYRLRYDLLRCGSPDSIAIIDAMMRAFDPAGAKLEKKALAEGDIPEILKKVLDYDAAHPAHNDPEDICNLANALQGGAYAPVSQSDWAPIRHTLRIVTEGSLAEMNKDKR